MSTNLVGTKRKSCDQHDSPVQLAKRPKYSVEKILSYDENTQKYLVKFKGLSYKRCEWLTREQIVADKGSAIVTKFHKYSQSDGFNPDYTIVERLIDYDYAKNQFLVKWKSLPYIEATWEPANEIPLVKIQQYIMHNQPPLRLFNARPPASLFRPFIKSPLYKRGLTLRDYQVDGLNWLRYCWYNRRSSILADEMGLGKTIQTIAILDYLHRRFGIFGPFLIVAPLSTIEQWKREIETWTNFNVVVFHGNLESRDLIVKYEWYFKSMKTIFKFNILVTTYETLIQEETRLGKIHWKYMVVDEAHRLKNKESKILKAISKFKAEHKLLLTGSPVQNNLEELFTLLNFLDPKKFSQRFMDKFKHLTDVHQVQELHESIRPYILRRLKENVEKSIPLKEEIVVELVPTQIQKTYYRAVIERNRNLLINNIKDTNDVPSLMNIMMEQRKVCNHPFLIKGVRNILTQGMSPEEISTLLVSSSSKMIFLDKLLKKLRSGNHKVIIFSQMVQMLLILKEYLTNCGFPFERLDGTIRGIERQAVIDRFNDPNGDVFVLLASTRAGGVGINLAAADTVIIYDSDWNPQADIQAQARCHRIGQTKEVKVYRLLTKYTFEKKLFERASKKLGLEKLVLNGHTRNKMGLQKEEIEALLKYGAYVTYLEEEGEEEFLKESDIDQILEKSATLVKIDGKSQNKFSVASFNIDETNKNYSLNILLPDISSNISERIKTIKTQDEKDHFFNELKLVVEDQLSKIDYLSQQQQLSLENLLKQVINSKKFNEEQNHQINAWIRQVKSFYNAIQMRRAARELEIINSF